MMKLDRLSNFPEEILMHILRFMETKHAIQTSVLSKQWTNLWTKVPSLYIDADSFHNVDAFVSFLHGLIVHYAAPEIFSCKFVCSEDDLEHGIFTAIVSYANLKKVKCLSIHCPSLISTAPPQIFSCRYLLTLSLTGCAYEFPDPFYCALLRSICLDGVFIDNDIFMYCPNLERCFIMDCLVSDLSIIVIKAPKLVKLDIQCARLDDNPPEEMVVHIEAPVIESLCLHFDCDSYIDLSLDGCPNLLEYAWIDIYDDSMFEKIQDVIQRRKYALKLVDFLKDNVSDVRSLTFSPGTLKVLYEFPELVKNLPSPFHNLKSLQLYLDTKNQPAVIPPEVETFLVGASPNSSEILEVFRVWQ
ncbi:hypothetical protein ACFE04_008476 [Oxalis oulophora]